MEKNCRIVKKRNILYESICQLCNPEEENKRKDGKLSGKDGIYVGESGRSLYERAGEHIKDARGMEEKSHIVKHWATSHPELKSPPKFKMKIVSSFQDAMTRQISESVRIDMRGGGVLNSKTEYSRCRLPRLVIDNEEWKKAKKEERKLLEINLEDPEELTSTSTGGLEMESSRMEKKRKDKDGTNTKPPKNNKKRKLEPLIDWGENKIGTEQGIIPREWFLTSLEEENEKAEIDLDLNIEVDWRSKPRMERGRKMKQLEIDFSKAIIKKNKEDEKHETEVETSQETEVEDETIPDGRKYIKDCDGGRTGVHAPTGSSSNIVLIEDSEDITKDTSEEAKGSKDKEKGNEAKPLKTLKTKPYKRNTGKIKKKEAITLTKKNMKITSWIKDKTWSVRKERRETEYRRLEDETVLDMEWSDPTEEQRKTEKLKKAQRKKDHLLNTLMIREMMTKMAGEIPALASVMEVVDIMVEEAVETGEVEMIWRQMIKDEKVLRKLEKKIEERKSSQRLEEEEKLKQGRLEAQKVMKDKWLRRMEINQLIDDGGRLDLSEYKDDWNDLDEDTKLLDDWLILACENGTLVDEDEDMANSSDGAEAGDEVTIEDASMMEIVEEEWMNSEDMDVSEHKDYEDWLESELVDMNIDGGIRDLIFREENITKRLNYSVNIVNNADRALISREAYENGGSWLVDRWVCPGDRVGRGENNEDNVCAVYQSRANDRSGESNNNNMETVNKRKRTRPPSSSTMSRRTPPPCPRRRPRRIVTGRRRLSREQNNLSGFDTAVWARPGWKSSQDCEDGCVPDQESVPELEVSREEDHLHGGGAQGRQQGADGGGVVAPGGEGGVEGGQGDGAGHGHHHSREDGEQRAGGGTDAGGVLHDGGEHLVQGGHVQVQVISDVTSRKPKPMYFKRKRGIVPDGLVQMRLSNFRKQFPNLQPTWAVTTGPELTNGRTAVLQRDISTNGVSDRKRKLDQDFVVLPKKRRESTDSC